MILAPTLTLSAGSGAAIVRPTFSRDFAGEKTLNNGTGPAITFTRGSIGTFFDANGTLQTASNDVPRFDHDPATGASRGLLIEEARTNSIRNSQAGGSTAGVIGSGGVMPTFWTITANANSVTSEIVGTGTEGGLAYIDIKVSGTPTAGGSVFINQELSTQIVAANGQTWTAAFYVKLAGGSVANTTMQVALSGRLVGGSPVAGQEVTQVVVPTSSDLVGQRYSVTRTFSSASVERVLPTVVVIYTSGSQIGGSADGITLRIAAPQLEQGAFPTSYIPTTSAAVTRSADSAVVTPISGFYNQSEGTLFAEASPRSATEQPNVPRIVVNLNSNSSNEQITIAQDGTNDAMLFVAYILAGGGSPAMTGGSSITTTTQRVCAAYKQSDFAASFNGGVVDAETSGNVPSGITHMHIGMRPDAGAGALSGHIRKIAYYPKRLSNALLQSLTA